MRAQRSNPESLGEGSLDCFVASAQNCFAILSRAPRNDGICGWQRRSSNAHLHRRHTRVSSPDGQRKVL
ncbi:hypothetical protein EAS62_19995 [Bradyrhizobium zhanjiangense]|uniref:Uncharacterized protein n=1 Tax=Bradyrhizobium zhanjiangense TaxID=1325107 RepID=A0ABY0DI60_9BRAD|nr:hypothetical protein EAS62_19995 [Bradyrhizobium zhanjiangense]